MGIAAASALSGEANLRIYLRGIVSAALWSGLFASGSWAFLASGAGRVPVTTPPGTSGDAQIILGKAITQYSIQLDPRPAVLIGA